MEDKNVKQARLEEIQSEIARLSVEREALQRELHGEQPYQNLSLTDAVLAVLAKRPTEFLGNAEVENLVQGGGYTGHAKNSRSSVKITLRRLAFEGRCQVKAEGKRNVYSAVVVAPQG